MQSFSSAASKNLMEFSKLGQLLKDKASNLSILACNIDTPEEDMAKSHLNARIPTSVIFDMKKCSD